MSLAKSRKVLKDAKKPKPEPKPEQPKEN